MNILIVTPFYKQDKNIASVRWTKLAPRLAKNHNVIVVTQPIDDMDMTVSITEEDGIRVVRANQKSFYEKIAVRYFHGATGNDWQTKVSGSPSDGKAPVVKDTWKRRLKNRLFYASAQSKARSYAKWICRHAIPDGMKIDVVISSACPFIEMLFGYELKKCLHCKWVCEFRDLPFTNDYCDDTHRQHEIMNHLCPCAEAIITIAPLGKTFMKETFALSEEKIHVITNGFSLDDRKETENSIDDFIHIVHVGNVYEGRNPELLFAALKEALHLSPGLRFSIECAGANNTVFQKCAQKYNLETIYHDKGLISRENSLSLQANADFLLLLTSSHIGSLAAKIFEYMLVQKNIICVTCGGNKRSEEQTLVDQLNLGISICEAEWDDSVSRLAQWLVKMNEARIMQGKMPYHPNFDGIKRFNHDNISKQLENLLTSL